MKNDSLKLWRIHLRGVLQRYNPSYVVATDPSTAYNVLRDLLDKLDYGFPKERELDSIELLAEDYEYTEVGSRLIVRIKEVEG